MIESSCPVCHAPRSSCVCVPPAEVSSSNGWAAFGVEEAKPAVTRQARRGGRRFNSIRLTAILVALLVMALVGIIALALDSAADPLREKAEAAADFTQGALTLNSGMLAKTLPRKYQGTIPAIVSAANITLGADALIGRTIMVEGRAWEAESRTLVVTAAVPALKNALPNLYATQSGDSASGVAFYFVPDPDSNDVALEVHSNGNVETLGVLTLESDRGWRVMSVNGTSVDETLGRLFPESADIMSVAVGNFEAARGSAQSKSCFANERTLEGAFQMALADGDVDLSAAFGDYKELTDSLVPAYIKSKPQCPTGGDYNVARDAASSGVVVSCSVHGHY